MKMNILTLAAALLATCCTPVQPYNAPDNSVPETPAVTFAKGADVSWLTQMESEGLTFKNKAGESQECMALLRDDCGVNAIRLRVWVNPAEGWNNIDDVLVKARRAASLGLAVMIDFHFSDTWADPANQNVPAAWASHDITALQKDVKEHVTAMLTALKTYGVTPQWVQIGNETRGGMMYPLGKYENGANFAQLVNAGYDAVKAIFPDTQVIVHIDSGDRADLYARIFGYLKLQNGKYDIIGVSFYPEAESWQASTATLVSNIKTANTTYGKPVMICEIGMTWSEGEACKSMISQIMKDFGTSGDVLKGIFYWEPEAPAGYNGGYAKGCFADGTPTVALDPFITE
ncbi:MAG: glycosyl hydrolase 53 family protein [Bacteroidales bacterium]|nr:glycosyl hydrolase 53 family protein [Bacteroidales bacterium]